MMFSETRSSLAERQIVVNFRRKSTEGLSRGLIVLWHCAAVLALPYEIYLRLPLAIILQVGGRDSLKTRSRRAHGDTDVSQALRSIRRLDSADRDHRAFA
jgi:hypothetical protein